jgi:hypothetical protein
MYFADLTHYIYHGSTNTIKIYNIGWLVKGKPFPTGITTDEFQAKLHILSQHRVNLCRGFHTCEFCIKHDAQRGNGEIRVFGNANDGIIYVAPMMIHHYVQCHEYKPPQEFITAVMNTDQNKVI